jgi:quercetin dioxygenase-like cupin family protein
METYFLTQGDCVRQAPFPGVEVFAMLGDHLMLSIVELQPGAIIEEHSHHHEQLGMLLSGEGTYTIGGLTRHVRPGDLWRIPGNVAHKFVAGDQPVRAIEVFYPIREEYVSADQA